MANINAKCPRCGGDIVYDPLQNGVCALCKSTVAFAPLKEYASGEKNTKDLAMAEAEDMFLSGSSFLALKDYEQAAQLFLGAAKLYPANSKYWLYLLAAITEKFRLIYLLADKNASRNAGDRKVIVSNVYKNFVSTAKKNDYVFANGEFGIDFSPESGEIWEAMLVQILKSESLPYSLSKASEIAVYACEKLLAVNEKAAKRYYAPLCQRLNPVKEGVLEVNCLMFYPEFSDGVLRIDTEADTVEFASDDMPGAERFSAFLLTRNIENIGTHFPFRELIVDEGVQKIPDKLFHFCGGLQRVKLSDSVRVIGDSAFVDCANLCSVAPLDKIEEIGSRAFFGTSIRTLDIPPSVRRLGSEILGVKTEKSAECEIEKYLFKIDSDLAQASQGFNAVGLHKAGYLARRNGKLKLIYPSKSVGSSAKALSGREKMIFKALAYASIDDGDTKSSGFGVMDRLTEIFKRKK